MTRLALALVPLSFALAGAAFAQAAAPAAPQPAHEAAMSTMRKENRDLSDIAARRMTDALNILEAKGYGAFKNFRADGKNFAATVTQEGKEFTVTIDPDSRQVTRQG